VSRFRVEAWPAALAKFITLARSVLAFAGPEKSELIDVPVRFGDQFDKPPKLVMRWPWLAVGRAVDKAA